MKKETGFEYVVDRIDTLTPFGKAALKAETAFFPGEEIKLRNEYGKLEAILKFVNAGGVSDELLHVLSGIKDIRYTIERSGNEALSVPELFEVKSLLIKMEKLAEILSAGKVKIPDDYHPSVPAALLGRLDPRKERTETFYIYDEYSENLMTARKRKKETEEAVRKERKRQSGHIKEKYNIELTLRFEFKVSKTNPEKLNRLKEIPELAEIDEDYVSATFALKNTAEIDELMRKTDDAALAIEKEESIVREALSRDIADNKKELLKNCAKIGEFDFALAKARYAEKHNCVIPEIRDEHVIEIEGGRHLQAEDALALKNKPYFPVSISLKDGVTCLTGANMGGKTVSLKLVGLVSLLAQHAFFVPCERAAVGLSSFTHILIGDNQSVEKGLSEFGSEMAELKEAIDNAKERSLILIDEIAGGTNPAEGLALTKGVAEYLEDKPYISLLVTHFDGICENNIQVAGSADGRMDYRLFKTSKDKKVPRDALFTAKMLGVNDKIIEKARKHLEEEEYDERQT